MFNFENWFTETIFIRWSILAIIAKSPKGNKRRKKTVEVKNQREKAKRKSNKTYMGQESENLNIPRKI